MAIEYSSEEIIHMVRCLTSDCIQQINESYKEFGVTGIQYLILCKLEQEQEIKVSDLAFGLNITNSNLSAILKRLEQAGYVKRRRSKEDQRIVHVSLSKKGMLLLGEIHEKPIMQASLLEKASEDERQLIFEGLEILRRLIEENEYEK